MQFQYPRPCLRPLRARVISIAFALLMLGAALGLTAFLPRQAALTLHAARAAQPVVPPPPAQLADRFGIYNWNINDAAFPNDGSIDRLNWGAERVAQTGSRTIRVAMTSRDIYKLGFARTADLVQIAQHPAYARLLADVRFPTVMLTVYSRGAQANNWSDGFTAEEYNAERDEMRKLGEHLLGTPAFAGKTFILFNWEGDNAVYSHYNKRVAWDDYLSWIKARTEGVKLARQNRPTSQARLFSGLEFNLVRSYTGEPCGTPVADPVRQNPLLNRCVIDYVAPRVEVDYYSFSAWYSIGIKADNPAADLKGQLNADFAFALAQVRRQRPEITAHNFILGEYGFERVRHGECAAANSVNEMFDIVTAPDFFPLSYAIFWQIADNARSYGAIDGRFGLFRAEAGALQQTLLGRVFQKRLASETVEIPGNCPRIRRPPPDWGVLTREGTTDFSLNPDPVLAVFAANAEPTGPAPFSPTGNTARLAQLTRDYVLPRDNSQQWSESTTQINFALPATRRPGIARVYVTDARGIESNARDITLTCADCPHITGPCGIIETRYRTLHIEPGATIILPGVRFAPSGNTVVIEQRDARGAVRRWTLSGATALPLERETQINAKLPEDLAPGLETLLYIVNPQGRESNEVLLTIGEPCLFSLCAPRLSLCQGLVNEAGGDFLAGTVISINGRFVSGGNRVIVEQHDRAERLYRYVLAVGSSGWSETDERIRVALPATLFAGRALVYVIDALSRESRAQEIMVAPSPLAAVSAANYRGSELAAESIVALFGNAFSSTTARAAATPLPTELAETRAIVKDSAGAERPAPLFFVSPTQINLQIPPGTAEGTAMLTVLSSFGSSSSGTVQIVKVAPGLFSANATGRGVAAAVALRVKADGTQVYEPVAVFDPLRQQFVARPLELGPPDEQLFLVMFGTGFRGRSAVAAVTATIGGAAAEVAYAGAQLELTGVDQANLRVPRSLAGRGEVDVSITIDGKVANTVKISIR